MQENIERKCHGCKQQIKIKRSDVHDVVYYEKRFYHTKCFIDVATKRSKSKGVKAMLWANALEQIPELENDTIAVLNTRVPPRRTDALNEYLLKTYQVTSIDARFWQTIWDLNNGIYKQRRCNKVSIETLYEAWKWGQKNLDDIARRNKANHRGPTTNDQRLLYDFAIVVKHVPEYLDYKKKQEAAAMEMRLSRKETIDIDYSKIKVTKRNEGLDDISSLLDDLI